ncbi:GntR family transcriptional regulator [Enterococcus hulanensis]|uniref:GntR family transcriptional regulator n=1 Tax=Enterococcus TaxID=1350 RepID=UPI000B5ABA76|nr:GntR family transcriptional regulator [Enterococcus hulanensis]MBO0412565.1 GntR family transcriptional regulator [Enterococcus hulanensis]OTO18848.1 GntR family transcriptional regulator [Enterococcus sp. 3H8_DIV0648]
MSTTVKRYTEIYQQIKQDIESGIYKINEKLPQGRLLAKKYQVSELTITKALNVLVREGYIVRRRGSGSFVKDFQNGKLTKFSPLTGSFSVYDGKVESVIIGFSTEIPDEALAEKLGISQEILVYKIIRMRKIEGIPSIIEYTWMPTNVITGLTMKELETSIYKYISDTLKLKVKSAHVNIAGIRPSLLEKSYLNLTDNDFLMSVEQVAYLDDGRIFEFSIANHIPSEFNFETVLIAD